MNTGVRIDKWLWTARFYKTRNLASNAVEGGKVHVNGSRVKPSYRVKLEDVITISRPPAKIQVNVKGIDQQRRQAGEAQKLYEESEESIAQRELIAAQRKILNQGIPRFTHKPDKHQRRKIRDLKGKSAH